MKKIISIILTLALICGISAIGASAAELNVAPTKTAQLFFSSEPYADITTINGYVYGYIGDSDDDGTISILDATEVQLSVAQLTELSKDGSNLADVDFDEEITVFDATEIQLFIAQMSENQYISHTLYEDDLVEYTFDQIVHYITEYGDYDAAEGYYCTYYSPSDINDVECTLMLVYYPDEDTIDLYMQYYQVSSDVWADTIMRAYRGNPEFVFGWELHDNDYTYGEAYGTSTIYDLSEMTFLSDCESFDGHGYYRDFSQVESMCETQFEFTIAVADELLWEHIDHYVSDIFW